MIPSIGRVVHYKLTSLDVVAIAEQRLADCDKRGNAPSPGDTYAMMVTRVWAPPEVVDEQTAVQGQVFLDGNDVLWVTSRSQGPDPGMWHEPERTPVGLVQQVTGAGNVQVGQVSPGTTIIVNGARQV